MRRSSRPSSRSSDQVSVFDGLFDGLDTVSIAEDTSWLQIGPSTVSEADSSETVQQRDDAGSLETVQRPDDDVDIYDDVDDESESSNSSLDTQLFYHTLLRSLKRHQKEPGNPPEALLKPAKAGILVSSTILAKNRGVSTDTKLVCDRREPKKLRKRPKRVSAESSAAAGNEGPKQHGRQLFSRISFRSMRDDVDSSEPPRSRPDSVASFRTLDEPASAPRHVLRRQASRLHYEQRFLPRSESPALDSLAEATPARNSTEELSPKPRSQVDTLEAPRIPILDFVDPPESSLLNEWLHSEPNTNLDVCNEFVTQTIAVVEPDRSRSSSQERSEPEPKSRISDLDSPNVRLDDVVGPYRSSSETSSIGEFEIDFVSASNIPEEMIKDMPSRIDSVMVVDESLIAEPPTVRRRR